MQIKDAPAEYRDRTVQNEYLKMNGIELGELRRDYVRLYVDLRPAFLNPYGMAHGGLLFTLGDCCAGINARSDGHNYVTLDADFHFLRNQGEGRIIAESYVLRRGRTTCVLRVSIHNEEGTVLADGTFTMYRVGDKL